MTNNLLRLLVLTVMLAFSGLSLSSQPPAPEVVSAHGESYVNLQLCANTWLEYRKHPGLGKQFLDASHEIQAAYTTEEQLDAFVEAIQAAHDRQGSIEVRDDESREEFYLRVFSEQRCKQELEAAEAFH